MTDSTSVLDLGALTDEQIQSMSPDQIDEYLKAGLIEDQAEGVESATDVSEPAREQDDTEAAAADEERDTDAEVTGGADSDFQSLDPYGETAVKGSDDQLPDTGTVDQAVEGTVQSGEDDQSDQAGGDAEPAGETSGRKNWKSEYEALKAQYDSLLGSFKASGRTVKVESPDDARRLMQMGYDYNLKMRDLKPRLRTLKTLEHNGLLDDEKLNFAIDLLKGNPEAIKKFLKDHEIDPIEMDLESGTDYKPNDHRVSDQQVALDEVLDSLKSSDAFPRTAQVITKEWDKASQEVLLGTPAIIAVINDHMEKGYYDQIASKVQYERSLGRLTGLSDLDAYKTVGDALQAQGAFAPTRPRNTPAEQSGQGSSQDLQGSNDSVKGRKRAASPTKGGASAGKVQKSFLRDYTDAEIEAMGMPPL